MTMVLEISNISFRPAAIPLVAEGLLGWVAFTLDKALRIEGVALRRTIEGHLTLSFPSYRDRYGNERYCLRPLNDSARQAIEEQVFQALGLSGEDAP
jgi:DNA-binding cell septation regulator SpoVG